MLAIIIVSFYFDLPDYLDLPELEGQFSCLSSSVYYHLS